MQKKIKNINVMNFIWLQIYLLPLLICVGWCAINNFSNSGSLYALSDFVESIKNAFLINIPITNVLESCINYLGFNNVFSDFMLIVFSYITYLVLVVFIRVLFDVLIMLPNIIHHFIDRVGGEKE